MSWVQRYLKAGLTPIPLIVGEKAPPIHSGYQSLPAETQWENTSKKANIGLLCGNGFVVADGDEPRTVEYLRNAFDRLGLQGKLPEVITTHEDHRQFYLKVEGVPQSEYCRNWNTEVGKGELRLSGVYVVAPGSTVHGMPYRFVNGSPETYQSTPVIQWKEIAWLVPNAMPTTNVTDVPVRLIRRYDLPERAYYLFNLLRGARAGKPIDNGRYGSRSNAEAAIVTMAILAGWKFEEIQQLFDYQQPAKYVDKKQYGVKYLEITYNNELNWLASSHERQVIADAYQYASSMAWPGRSGGNDRAVMLAILSIAWQFSSYVVHASVRDIGEHAAIDSISTISTATTSTMLD